MFYNDKITGKRIWKYQLVDEVIAAASAGMSATTRLDQRCIIFTIHLSSSAGHPPLCRTLFDTADSYFIEKGVKRRSASHSGLASFIDVNGSKFSGADRDQSQVHCHGFIFIPWNTCREDILQLIAQLEFEARQVRHEGRSVVKSTPDAVEIKMFDPARTDTDLCSWTEYAQKEAVRIATEGDLMVILPFDRRKEYGEKASRQIDGKRQKTLAVLGSKERFKILTC